MELLLECLSSYKISAKRLETLPVYKIYGDEWDEYNRYIQGIPEHYFKPSEWFQDIKNKTKNGIITERVRVMPKNINSYIRFEVETGYLVNSIAGEKFYFISEEKYRKLVSKDLSGDYWIFDDKKLLKMNYSNDGEFLNSTLISSNELLQSYIELYSRLKENSNDINYLLRLMRNVDVKYE